MHLTRLIDFGWPPANEANLQLFKLFRQSQSFFHSNPAAVSPKDTGRERRATPYPGLLNALWGVRGFEPGGSGGCVYCPAEGSS